MNTLKRLIAALLLCSFCSIINAQNFQFKNWIWAYPNCNAPTFVKTWWDSGNGKLRIYTRSNAGATYVDVVKMATTTKYGAGAYQFFSSDNFSDVYTFYSNNTARLFERIEKGRIIVSNGMIIEGGKSTDSIYACDPKSKAAEYIMDTINQTNSSTASQREPKETKQPNKKGGDIWHEACDEPKKLLMDTIALSPSFVCLGLTNLKLCLDENGGRDAGVEKLLKQCEEQQRQDEIAKCSNYAQAKQTCAPAANYESCMGRLGFSEWDLRYPTCQ
jgi:hypothetical protein